ncbi:hypothetical protein I5523_08415 [Acinetobacter oleivorans]|uniref:hypothetical protein n=1 Tax=Acinetobacter oleivorans TaxID=1148157 RepID=UPI0019012E82|nr:hypothetical protein [Acinetobacter oleivorans]MBJ9739665.1 hypothetical protein [Acinetobacter oleivorans]MCU4409665.1 hypothetical protein [Acinetobacter oleivorans]
MEALAFTISNNGFFQFLISIITISAIAIILIRYLNQSNKVKRDRVESEIFLESKYLEKLRSELQKKIDGITSKDLNFTEQEKINIINDLKNKILTEASDSILNDIKTQIGKNIFEESIIENIDRSFRRLYDEKNSLFIRGNFNLVIGVILSGIGGSFAYFFIQKLPVTSSGMQLVSYSFPRISLFMLFALLVFFFLNLYKKSLEDIKYYQNEITNLEAKYLSLRIAKKMNNHKLLGLVLENLIKTERNFILEKGQTTVELEKEKNDSNSANKALDTLKEILKNQK